MDPVFLYRLGARLHHHGWHRAAKATKALNVAVNRAFIDPRAAIGCNFSLEHRGFGVVVHPCTRIGDDVFVHHNVTFATDVPLRSDRRMTVGDRVTIGTGVVIRGPVTIGSDVVIGAGSVVTKNVPPGAVVGGVPARILSRDGAVRQKYQPGYDPPVPGDLV